MLHATERLTGPRYLDADIANRVKDATIKRYRLALQRFLSFLLRNKYFPSVPAEFDDLLVEWKHTDVVTKSTFEGAIAAIEFTLPTFKGELKWARAVAAAWEINEPVSHKNAAFVAVHMAA